MNDLRLGLCATLLIAATAPLLACSNGGTSNSPGPSTHASVADTSDAAPAADGATDAAVDAPDAGRLNDPEILGVLSAANAGEVQEGQLAGSSAGDARVKAFAAQLVSDHTMAQASLASYEQANSVTAAPSADQARLLASGQQTLASLQSLTGHAFDVAYVQAQVTAHTQVLALIDEVLLPSATSAGLRAIVQSARTMVAGHLAAAETLAPELADGGIEDGSAEDGAVGDGALE